MRHLIARAVLGLGILPACLAAVVLFPAAADAEEPRGGEREIMPCDLGRVAGNRGTMAGTLWPGGLVYYDFDASISQLNRDRTRASMDLLEAEAGVLFSPRTNEPNYIHIIEDGGNWSAVGMQGGSQTLSMYNWNYPFIICHELIHALGRLHQQSRSDRDNYITVNWECIDTDYAYNYNICQQCPNYGEYDFESVMHYSQWGFNIGCPTMTCLPGYEEYQDVMGQRDYLSDGDIETLQFMYPLPPGACCISDTCSIMTNADCSAAGGTYLGDASTCSGDECPSDDCSPQQTAKLTADDGASYDTFGHSVATSGGIAVIGARLHDDNGDASGSAYVYEQQGDGTWHQTAKLTADDGASGDYFGHSVALDAGVAVIGAYGDDDNGSWSGSAYVYEQQADGTWQQIAKLTPDDGANSDGFGCSVALDAGVAVIGALGDDDNGSASGSAYVYEQQGDGTWQQIAKLTADDGVEGDNFGYSIATSDGVAVIGAYYNDDNGFWSGSAYVYEQQGDGTWQQIAKLTADNGNNSDSFGYSVATSDGVAVIGAHTDDDNGSASGSAYVYEQQGDGTWQQTAKLTADDGASYDDFGSSVALDAGVAVIGALYDDDNGFWSGSAYVYEQQGDGTWQQIAKLTADDGVEGDNFGYSIATSDGVTVIGAYYDDDNGFWSGSAYVFDLTGADCNNNGICDADELLDGTVEDCDGNGVPDECEDIDDCNDNGLNDACDIADGTVEDCNANNIPDECDIAGGTSSDCNANGIPDECESLADCNDNGLNDACDIAYGTSYDTNGNGIPDECECAADIAGPGGQGFPDGIVGVNDLLAVIGYWGSSSPGGDVDGDGFVGVHDLLLVISAWGPCP